MIRTNWQYWNALISKEQCEGIIDTCYKNADFFDGTVFAAESNDFAPDDSIRDTRISWIHTPEIKELVSFYLLEANRNAFAFDVDWTPAVQFGEYTEGSFYNWHHDINWGSNSMYDRKLSIIIQLSDENDYEGGDFQFKNIETPAGIRNQGSILVFPSYNVHRVTEVTKGKRLSLVCWMEGPRWR